MLPPELRAAIIEAFRDVTLGQGIGLWQAQAIDDYEDEKGQLIARNRDEKNNWSKFDGNELIRCHSSLSFFDPDGMRFHLPAFMLSDTFRDGMDSLLYLLTDLDDSVLNMFSSLTNAQRAVVRDYLIWCKDQEEYEFEKEDINKSLREYWLEN